MIGARRILCGMAALALVAGIARPAAGARAAYPATTKLVWIAADIGAGQTPYAQIIHRYEALHPTVTITLKVLPPGDYYSGLLAAMTGAAPPDLVIVGDDAVQSFVKKKALLDLTPLIRTGGFNTGIYLPNMLAPGRVNGDLYLLPRDYTPFAVYYNKALFDAAHLAYPKQGWTWQQFLADARRLTRRLPNYGGMQYGVQGFQGAIASRGFEALAASTGARLISPDGKQYVGYMDSPGAIQALRFYGDLYGKYGVATPANFYGAGEDYFANGKAAMAISGHWYQKSYLAEKLRLGVVGLPRDTVQANAIVWSGLGIPSGSAHAAAAFQFLEFAAGQPGSLSWKNWTLSPVASTARTLASSLDRIWAAQAPYLKPIIAFSTPYWSTTAAPALQNAVRLATTTTSPGYASILRQAARTAQSDLDFSLKNQ